MSGKGSRQLAAGLGMGSVVFGVAPALLPRQCAWLFGVPEDEPAVQMLARSIGVRDAMIGAGLWSAAVHGGRYRHWLLARALSDTVDMVGVALAARAGQRNPRFIAVGLIAAGAAVYGLWLLSAVWSEEAEATAGS